MVHGARPLSASFARSGPIVEFYGQRKEGRSTQMEWLEMVHYRPPSLQVSGCLPKSHLVELSL
jgi:hypothetical protein